RRVRRRADVAARTDLRAAPVPAEGVHALGLLQHRRLLHPPGLAMLDQPVAGGPVARLAADPEGALSDREGVAANRRLRRGVAGQAALVLRRLDTELPADLLPQFALQRAVGVGVRVVVQEARVGEAVRPGRRLFEVAVAAPARAGRR